jgi:hypothetical protein
MTEQEFIANEQAKQDAVLRGQLEKVQRNPFKVGKKVIELLLVNGLIEFGGPSAKVQYNHYRLTKEGLAQLGSIANWSEMPTNDKEWAMARLQEAHFHAFNAAEAATKKSQRNRYLAGMKTLESAFKYLRNK